MLMDLMFPFCSRPKCLQTVSLLWPLKAAEPILAGWELQMRELWKALEHENRALPVQIGLSETGSGDQFLARNIERFDPLGQAILASPFSA